MSGHPLLWLAMATFVLVVAYMAWSMISTRRRQLYGPKVEGPGNEDDPMVGHKIDMPYVFDNRDHPKAKPRPGEEVRKVG